MIYRPIKTVEIIIIIIIMIIIIIIIIIIIMMIRGGWTYVRPLFLTKCYFLQAWDPS